MSETLRDTVLGQAVVTQFLDPQALAQTTGAGVSSVIEVLLPVVDTELDEAGVRRWTLRAPLRQDMLARSNRQVAAEWVRTAPTYKTKVERVLREWLTGALDLDSDLVKARDAVQLVASWLRPAHWVTPEPDEVIHKLQIASLRGRLIESCGPAFIGRAKERSWLKDAISRAHVAVIEADGGMGKSALLARWLLDQRAFEHGCVALTLDFDDPTLSVLNPDSLYIEIVRQAVLQVPAVAGIEAELRSQVSEARERKGEQVQGLERVYDDSRTTSLLYGLFSQLTTGTTSVLLVVDTFERALRGPRELCQSFVDQLRRFTGSQIGLIVAGRKPIDLPALQDVPRQELGPLSNEEAMQLLASRHVAPEVIPRILERVPGSPLTLRLAARCVESLGPAALDDAALDAAILASQIDGYLHARVLSHLPTPRLTAVARVALLLRVLTPQRMLDIVGPLVTPPITEADEASTLVEELAKVSDLVASSSTPERIELRLEVFEELSKLLTAENPRASRALHERAADVLEKSSDSVDQDDREYHVRALAEIGAPVVAQWSRSATVRELRAQVPSLMSAGRDQYALDLLTASRAAYIDPTLQLLGAKAARRVAKPEDCEDFARRALVVAKTPFERAQCAVFLAWVADQRGQAETARRERATARREFERIPATSENVFERATLIAELSVEDRDWSSSALAELFGDADADVLISADVDLTRQICALIGTTKMLKLAADIKAFEYTQALDFSQLAQVIAETPELSKSLGVGSTQAGLIAQLTNLQGSHQLGSTVSLMFDTTPDNAALRTAIVDLLEQMRAGPKLVFQIDASLRAQNIAKLVDSLSTKKNVKSVFDGIQSNTFKISKNVSKTQVHSSILQIDRMRLGSELVKQLDHHGFKDEAKLAADLFILPTSLKGSLK